MRVDKYLKVAKVLKKRTVAKGLAEMQRITVNGKTAKPSTTIKPNDIIGVTFGRRTLTIKVLEIFNQPNKEQVAQMYEILEESVSE